jgi:hypothetical protein
MAAVGGNENEATIRTFAHAKGINYPLVALKNIPRPYDVRLIPTTFFIDRKGVIQSVTAGYHDFNALKELASAGDFTGAPKPPPAATSRIQ